MLSLLGNDWFDHVDSFAPLLISGRGTDNAQTARDVVTRGLFAARVIDAALLQGEQCLLHEDAYNDLITSDKIVDIWSAAQRNMVA